MELAAAERKSHALYIASRRSSLLMFNVDYLPLVDARRVLRPAILPGSGRPSAVFARKDTSDDPDAGTEPVYKTELRARLYRWRVDTRVDTRREYGIPPRFLKNYIRPI